MDLSFGIGFALPMALGLAALGSGIGLGLAVMAAMNAMGRQPEASGKIQLAMLLGCAFIEALTIYALVVYVMGSPLAKQAIEASREVGLKAAEIQAMQLELTRQESGASGANKMESAQPSFSSENPPMLNPGENIKQPPPSGEH